MSAAPTAQLGIVLPYSLAPMARLAGFPATTTAPTATVGVDLVVTPEGGPIPRLCRVLVPVGAGVSFWLDLDPDQLGALIDELQDVAELLA